MWIAAFVGATKTSGYCLGFSNEFRFFEYLALTFDGAAQLLRRKQRAWLYQSCS
jgi:hypothetical protein